MARDPGAFDARAEQPVARRRRARGRDSKGRPARACRTGRSASGGPRPRQARAAARPPPSPSAASRRGRTASGVSSRCSRDQSGPACTTQDSGPVRPGFAESRAAQPMGPRRLTTSRAIGRGAAKAAMAVQQGSAGMASARLGESGVEGAEQRARLLGRHRHHDGREGAGIDAIAEEPPPGVGPPQPLDPRRTGHVERRRQGLGGGPHARWGGGGGRHHPGVLAGGPATGAATPSRAQAFDLPPETGIARREILGCRGRTAPPRARSPSGASRGARRGRGPLSTTDTECPTRTSRAAQLSPRQVQPRRSRSSSHPPPVRRAVRAVPALIIAPRRPHLRAMTQTHRGGSMVAARSAGARSP